MTALAGHVVKSQPGMQEPPVQYLGPEDPLEEKMATHSSILAWSIPWTEKPGSLQPTGVAKSQTQLSNFTHHKSVQSYAF